MVMGAEAAGNIGDRPGLFGDFDLCEGLFGSLAEGGAGLEVGEVGDVAAVLFALEDVDVVVLHAGSGSVRL
jgi:hypothetical protein